MSKKVFDNVSRKRLATMKAIMRRRVSQYARQNGYEIQTWKVPEASDAVWHVVLKGKKGKPKLDFMARVHHDASAQRLTISLMRKPWFVSNESALAQVQSVYRASRT